MYKLRAHHLLCMRLFVGEGYSDAFASNMQRCIDAFTKEPSLEFQLVPACDDICMHCPNLNSSYQCSQGDQNILHKDRLVAEILELKMLDSYSYSEIGDKILKLMKNAEFERCCSTCKWYEVGLCSFDNLVANLSAN